MIATAVVLLFLAFRTVFFLIIRLKQPRGRCVPLTNPLQWIIINENETSFFVTRYSLPGRISGSEMFEKYINTDRFEAEKFQVLPGVRRVKFHSYITVAEKTRSEFIFSDPLREMGYFFYPPDFRCWVIPLAHGLPAP